MSGRPYVVTTTHLARSAALNGWGLNRDGIIVSGVVVRYRRTEKGRIDGGATLAAAWKEHDRQRRARK